MPFRPVSRRRRRHRLLATIVFTAAATFAVVVITNRGGAAPPSGPGPALVDLLTVTPVGSEAGYERELFPHWVDGDGDGCDTRDEVLLAELRPARVAGAGAGVGAGTDGRGCTVTGEWSSSYDGYVTDDPADLEIDHTVALAEAWRSGAATWSLARRQAFANDTGYAGTLVAVTAATNRAKSDSDPASWQPPNRAAWCVFGTNWVFVKYRWQLTADAAEARALRNLLRGCPAADPPPRA